MLSPALRPQRFRPLGDFFGFFGALKRADFFGLDPKKVFVNKPRARSKPLRSPRSQAPLGNALSRSSASTATYVESTKPKPSVSRLPSRANEKQPACGHEKATDFFGVHPKKLHSPNWRRQEKPARPKMPPHFSGRFLSSHFSIRCCIAKKAVFNLNERAFSGMLQLCGEFSAPHRFGAVPPHFETPAPSGSPPFIPPRD